MTDAADHDEHDEHDLLEGLTGEERRDRLRLVRELERDGVPVEEIARAAREDRLAMLPVERALVGPARHTPREVAARVGLPVDFLLAVEQAAGLRRPDPDETSASERDVEMARSYASLLAVGLPEERLVEVVGVFGRGLGHAADAVVGITGEAFLREGLTERELAAANAYVASELLPLLAPMIEHVLRRHLLDRMREEHFQQSTLLSEGRLSETHRVAVAFADLVGFTPLGARLEPDEVGQLVRRLERLASTAAAARPPVRLVKTIGDAVMLVAPDVDAVVGCVAALVRETREGGRLPPLRAGVAYGDALRRSGDWFGHPVNLASRLVSLAPSGTVLATDEIRAASGPSLRWAAEGRRTVRGIEGTVPVFRLLTGP